jgi:hypothetical protein
MTSWEGSLIGVGRSHSEGSKTGKKFLDDRIWAEIGVMAFISLTSLDCVNSKLNSLPLDVDSSLGAKSQVSMRLAK